MTKLGYSRFATQGGDWGSFISAQLGHAYPEKLIGVHIHTPAPLNFMEGQSAYEASDFGPEDAPMLAKMARMTAEEMGYFMLQKTRPQTPAVALADSPVAGNNHHRALPRIFSATLSTSAEMPGLQLAGAVQSAAVIGTIERR